MALYSIPISVPTDLAYFDMPLTLRDVTYTFTMRYNTRSDLWTADLGDLYNNLIVAGLPLRTGRNVLQPFLGQPNIPYGALFVVDTTGNGTNPGRYSFASTHKLMFTYRE